MTDLRETFVKMFDKEPSSIELNTLVEKLNTYQQVIEEGNIEGAIPANDYILLNGGDVDMSYFEEDGGDA